jgi:DNA-binding transcriptional LysR family regulator
LAPRSSAGLLPPACPSNRLHKDGVIAVPGTPDKVTSAAQRLGVTPSAISRTLGRLELRLGLRLLNRTTRSVSPTQAGELLYARLLAALAELDDAVSDVVALGDTTAGIVRLNLPRMAMDLVLTPLLSRFTAAHPRIELDLVIDDGLSDVVAEGFDAGIRIGEHLANGMVAIRVSPELRNAIVGSPGYFARRPRLHSPQDLRDHACLNYRWSRTGELYRWSLDGADGLLQIEVKGPLAVNDTGALRDAALAGVGLACLPEAFLGPYIERGQRVRVLEAYSKPFPGFYLYHPSRTRTPPALRALITFLQTEAFANAV